MRCKPLQLSNRKFKPSRLIDLGEIPALVQPRLVMTASIEEEIDYITLSHCRGTGQFMQLTNSSLTDITKGIPISGLSRTFRDTMETAKQLGFCYV